MNDIFECYIHNHLLACVSCEAMNHVQLTHVTNYSLQQSKFPTKPVSILDTMTQVMINRSVLSGMNSVLLGQQNNCLIRISGGECRAYKGFGTLDL